MSQPIRVAVLGFGLAGRVFHCPFVSAVPGLELYAVVQRRGDDAQEAYPNARIVRSADAVFQDPAIDLVVVATPNDTHEDLARQALAAGKHVVVDKPLAPSTGAIRGLIDAAQAAGKLLIPFHNRRWDGDFLTLQKLMREQALGRVVEVTSQWDRFRPIPREGTWKEQGGPAHGMLQDLGPHLLDQALTLFGSPQRLTASVRSDRVGSQIEDAFEIVLEFEVSGHLLRYRCGASMIAAEASPRFRVHGTHGSFTKHGLDPQEAHLVAGGRLPPRLDSTVPWIEEPEIHWGTLTVAPDPAQPAELNRAELPTLQGDYRLFYAGVRDAVQGKSPAPVLPSAALHVAQLIEIARESSREARTLEVVLA